MPIPFILTLRDVPKWTDIFNGHLCILCETDCTTYFYVLHYLSYDQRVYSNLGWKISTWRIISKQNRESEQIHICLNHFQLLKKTHELQARNTKLYTSVFKLYYCMKNLRDRKKDLIRLYGVVVLDVNWLLSQGMCWISLSLFINLSFDMNVRSQKNKYI